MRGFGLNAVLLAMVIPTVVPAVALAAGAGADPATDLAKKLANPVAALISMPLQYSYDANYGADDEGSKSLLKIQPVIPFSLGEHWNLITRTIAPLVALQDIPSGTDESGLGDIMQSFWFSPKQPIGGWILAVGPVINYPTASKDVLGGGKWGTGPTVLALKQTGGMTYGIMANHVWSIAGDEGRADMSATFLQPFFSYVTKAKTTLSLNTESGYDWEAEQWLVPLNLSVAQLLKAGKLPLSLKAQATYYADSPEHGPEGFGFGAGITFLLPK